MVLAASTMVEAHPSCEIMPQTKYIYWHYARVCLCMLAISIVAVFLLGLVSVAEMHITMYLFTIKGSLVYLFKYTGQTNNYLIHASVLILFDIFAGSLHQLFVCH